jgi:hypothetical protein
MEWWWGRGDICDCSWGNTVILLGQEAVGCNICGVGFPEDFHDFPVRFFVEWLNEWWSKIAYISWIKEVRSLSREQRRETTDSPAESVPLPAGANEARATIRLRLLLVGCVLDGYTNHIRIKYLRHSHIDFNSLTNSKSNAYGRFHSFLPPTGGRIH